MGQDGHDLAGGAQPLGGNGVQDIHVAISGIPASETIAYVDVKGDSGGEWYVNIGPYSRFNGSLVETPGTTTADLYLDPRQVETGRHFEITLTYNDGSSVSLGMNGGAANPNVRMPADALAETWLGQDGKDYTSIGASVGPDGNQDVHIAMSHLFAGTSLTSVTVTASPSGTSWGWGTNPNLLNNAELIHNSNDPSQADLYFSPNSNLVGQTLTVSVVYSDDTKDQATLVAGTTNPTLSMPTVTPVTVNWNTINAQWLGQDGLNLLGTGDAHVGVSGIPAGRTVVSASLSDPDGSVWFYSAPNSGSTTAEPVAMRLGLRAETNPTTADITFPPNRNESGATMTVRLVLDDGSILATRLAAGATDPGLRVAGIAPTSVVAYPGDDIESLANSYGTVRLVSGLYSFDQPLVLNHPVTIVGSPGTLLVFSQTPTAPSWTTAIKVNRSHTTLTGFAVRFATPIRWTDNISYGPAVIGVTDNYDLNNGDPKVDLVFSRLDLKSPPPTTSWEQATGLFRLNNAGSGTIANNTLKGGTSEFLGGPWTITGNNYRGTPPNTYSYGVFSGHYTHDVTIANNTAINSGPSGKTWRFLVLTDNGFNDVIKGNNVVGLGPMDSDTAANPNAPEEILTEAYQIHYEGSVANVSSDGTVVQIPRVLVGQVRSGDVIAILNGPQAGQWRVIAQVINATTFLLNSPVVPGSFDISVATGFVNMVIDGNRIDARGSSVANDLVLAGNQFGVQVTNNTLLGGNNAFQISAYPTEGPYIWGWTHAPTLGALIENNTLVDNLQGGRIDVQLNQYTKSSTGRVYFTGAFLNNQAIWTSAYLSTEAAAGVTVAPRLVTVGNALLADPSELVLTQSGNSVTGPSTVSGTTAFYVAAGTLNGGPLTNQFVTISSTFKGTARPAPGSAKPTGKIGTVITTPAKPPIAKIAATSTPASKVATTQSTTSARTVTAGQSTTAFPASNPPSAPTKTATDPSGPRPTLHEVTVKPLFHRTRNFATRYSLGHSDRKGRSRGERAFMPEWIGHRWHR